MTTLTINWTPYEDTTSGVVTEQRLEYRESSAGDGPWLSVSGAIKLSPSLSTYVATELMENVLYEFRVITICPLGEKPSSVIAGIYISCPDISIIANINTLQVTITPVSSQVNQYTIDLLDGVNTISTKILQPNGLAILQQVFGNLESNKEYKVKVSVQQGAVLKSCPDILTKTLS